MPVVTNMMPKYKKAKATTISAMQIIMALFL